MLPIPPIKGKPETTIDDTEVFCCFLWRLGVDFCVFRNRRLTDPSGSHCQIWSMSSAWRWRFTKKMED